MCYIYVLTEKLREKNELTILNYIRQIEYCDSIL